MKPKKEFSKTLLIQESLLIWIMSLSFLILAFYCIYQQYLGSLPWLAAMVGFPWTAYGVSQVYYYKKSLAENTDGGVKYQSVITEIEKAASQYEDVSALASQVQGLSPEEELFVSMRENENPDDYQI